jgi:hypothetical protein
MRRSGNKSGLINTARLEAAKGEAAKIHPDAKPIAF